MRLDMPAVPPEAVVLPGAVLVGDVSLAAGASVWYNAVLRGDIGRITVGANSNLQDGCLLHTANGGAVTIGAGVTVGHGSILHGCTVGDHAFVGMGCIVMDNAVLEAGCMLGAGALVPGGAVIPAGMLALGSPARPVRPLSEAELAANRRQAEVYAARAREYQRAGLAAPLPRPEI